MKKLLVILLLCGWLPVAHAALSVTNGVESQGNPPGGLTFGVSVASGCVIVAVFNGTTGLGTLTVTDNVNSGGYSLLAFYSAAQIGIYWKVANATGTPTISITGQGGYTYADMFAICGFSGTPTSDVALQNTATGTSTTEAINATSNHNNEVMIVGQNSCCTSIPSSGPAGWTHDVSGNFNVNGYYAIEATSGTANNYSATLSSSVTWFTQLVGIYDAAGASCTHAGYTSGGAITVPTASVTSVLLPTGAFGTVDCSATNYWQPALGNFGVN